MKVLIVGGGGNVATWTMPYMREEHEFRVLDINPPRVDGVEYVQGSLTDPGAVAEALDGVDTFINMVMKSPTSSKSTDHTVQDVLDNYPVNTMGLHVLLKTAQEAGIMAGVHTSTFTVHNRHRDWYSAEEEVPLDAQSVYGLTKGFGEMICRYFCREFGMSIIALRLTGPRNREGWIEGRKLAKDDPAFLRVVDEEDMAAAYLAALRVANGRRSRYDAVFLSGDEKEEEVNGAKGRALLGWEPKAHLKVK